MQSRASALHNVESTIHELSNIFTQLATMVSQQGELAIRFTRHLIFFKKKIKIPVTKRKNILEIRQGYMYVRIFLLLLLIPQL